MTFQTLVIFDWDNTLFPSTFLSSNKCTLNSNIPPTIHEQISKLEELAITLITTAQQHGQVAIITNAEFGWVELSCKKYFPNLHPLLESVIVMSAQTTFKQQYPDEPIKWKECAFEKILYDLPHINHVVSIGDSDFEHTACRYIAKNNPNIITKLVKLIDLPSIDDMYRQTNLVINSFSEFHKLNVHSEFHTMKSF